MLKLKQFLQNLSRISLSGQYEDFSFEHRVFYLLCAFNLLFIFFSLLINYLVNLVWFAPISLLALGSILGITYYLFSIKTLPSTFALGILTFFDFLFFTFFWFTNGGAEGAVPYLFFALQNMIILVFKKSWLITLLTLFLVLLLTVIQLVFPDWVIPYPERQVLYFNFSLFFIIASLSITYTIVLLKADFNYQINFIRTQNQFLKKQNESLANTDQLRNKLLAIIAHDFRSPLQAIQTVMEMLINNELSEEVKRKIMAELTAEISYTNHFMDNLLSWAKSQMQENRVFPIDFSLYQLVESNLVLANLSSQQKNILIINEISPDVYVNADREMVNLIIRNLISNALKFSYPESKITISASIQGNEVICAVSDKGKGMSANQQANLFNTQLLFSKGTANEKGSGLGLILCKDFIEKNGGKLWFESQEKIGTVFYFSLPLAN